MSFENKVVIVTGSGSGMGEATAILFAKEGAHVVIVDFNADGANNTANQCKKFGKKVLVITADVSKATEDEKIIKQTIDTFGRLDVLVNNAGILREGNILDGTIMITYDAIMATNLRAVVNLTTLAAPHLVMTKGCIVNTSSVGSTVARSGPKFLAYCTSKAGVDFFTRASAMELAQSGVRVNAVNPGPVVTNLLVHSSVSGDWDQLSEFTALKKCAAPKEVGELILYLASDKAKSITGECILIDNGMSLV